MQTHTLLGRSGLCAILLAKIADGLGSSRLLRSRSAGVHRWGAYRCSSSAASKVQTVTPGKMEVVRIPCLKDNYVWLLHEPSGPVTAVVDPSESSPVMQVLKERGWKLDFIINTHHHWDHTGGNVELKEWSGCTVVGPRADQDRIPGIDVSLGDGDSFQLGALKAQVFDTPGHTRGHITYWFPEAQALFPGDTLFALGCGRLFEGTPQQMWASLSKMVGLPAETQVYCAHEYTQANARFAVTVDPDNVALKQRKEQIDDMRSQGIPTVPSTLGEELATNPFLRPHDTSIRQRMGCGPSTEDWEVFAAVRKAKDAF